MFDSIDELVFFILKYLPIFLLVPSCLIFKIDFKWVIIGQLIYSLSIKIFYNVNNILNKLLYKFYNKNNKNNYNDLTSLLKDKKVFCLLTGGSNGLGQALAQELLKKYGLINNFNLIIIDKQPLNKDFTKINNSDRILFLQYDLEKDITQLLPKLPSEMTSNFIHKSSSYKILINNCGTRHKFDNFNNVWSEDLFYKIFQINVVTGANLMQKLNPDYLITVSSILSMVTPKNASIYCASKSALSSIHESFVQIENKKGLLVLPGQLKDTLLFSNIKNEHTFFAPLVDINKLSKRIVDNMNDLHNGTILDPLYGNFIQLLGRFPYWIQILLRKFSGIDNAIDT